VHLRVEGHALLSAQEEAPRTALAENFLRELRLLGADKGLFAAARLARARGREAAIHEEGGSPAGEIGLAEIAQALEIAGRGRGLELQSVSLERGEGMLEKNIRRLKTRGGPHEPRGFARKEDGIEPLFPYARDEGGQGFDDGQRSGETLRRVEDGEYKEAPAQVLGHDGRAELLRSDTRYSELPLGKEAVIEAAGLERGCEAGFPRVVGQPAASGPLSEGLAEEGREELHLAEPVRSRDEGHDRSEIAASEELDLLAEGHLLEEHEEFGMPRLEPMENSARIMKKGRYIGEAIEDGEERPPAALVGLLERRFFSPFGQEIIGAEDDTASLHLLIVLGLTVGSIY
jgi:hypothetical protein